MRKIDRLFLKRKLTSTAGPDGAGSTLAPLHLVLKSWTNGSFLQNLEYHPSMRNLLCLLFLGGFLFTNLSAATIDYTLIDLGSGEYQYDYTISGTIGADQAIDIDFPTAVNLGDPNDSNLSIPVSPTLTGPPQSSRRSAAATRTISS